MNEAISDADATRITAYLDADAAPTAPSAHLVFGTNQPIPADLVARRYHEGLAPFIILTGGLNRHTGTVEAQEHRRILLAHDVPEAVIRQEGMSETTKANVEHALPLLEEALRSGLTLTAVCKWYHRRAIQLLRAFLPDVPSFHAVTWEPVYDGAALTRANWWRASPTVARRVNREWQVIPERVANGSLVEVELVDGAWR